MRARHREGQQVCFGFFRTAYACAVTVAFLVVVVGLTLLQARLARDRGPVFHCVRVTSSAGCVAWRARNLVSVIDVARSRNPDDLPSEPSVVSSLADLFGLLAVGCSGLFAGAALYINLVEHPARISCGVEIALRQWAPSYRRAAVMQASLAVLGGVAGVLAWALLGRSGYLTGAVLLLAVVPFTLLVVLPANTRLLHLHAKGQIGNADVLLKRWNALHAVRTGLSLAAFVLMMLALRE